MIRRSFLAFAAIAAISSAASPAWAQEQGAAEPRVLTDAERQLITDINIHNSAIKTMVGRFLQIDTQGQRIEGTFFLERPSRPWAWSRCWPWAGAAPSRPTSS